MKLVGLILFGLCSGFVSGTRFDPFALRRPFFDFELNDYCKQILNEYSYSRRISFPFDESDDILRLCGIYARFNLLSNTNLSPRERFRHFSTEVPSTTISTSTPVLITTKVSSEIRNPEFSNILTSEKKNTKDANPGKPDDFSTETSSLLKRNTDSTNHPEISDDDSIEISKGTEGTTEITSPEVSDESSSTQESYATKKSTVITNTTTSADFSKEISEATDVTSETTNSKTPDVHTSDETPGVTSDVTNSTFTDNKEQTESPSKLTKGIADVKDSSTPSPPVTTISKSTSDETTHVTDSLIETSSFTAGISESTISSAATEIQTTSDESHSTSTKNTVFMSTDYTTSEKTSSDREGGSSSTTVPSSSIRPNFLSTTRLYSTETTMNTSPRSQETTLDDTETTHFITTIELPEARILKLAVSITFLVIALMASVVLVVYFIVTRRRTFSYDELMLLP